MTINLEANFNIKFRSKLFLNLKSVLSNLEAIDIRNRGLNLKSSHFKFSSEDFVILHLEANLNLNSEAINF